MSRFSDESDAFESPFYQPPSLRLPSLPGRPAILEKIMAESIHLDEPQRYRRRAQFTFCCGDAPQDMAGYDGQLEVVGRCLEWFVFDYYIPAVNGTPAQYWLAKCDESLTPEQRADAWQCLDFILGIFEISDVEPNRGIHVLDLFRAPSDSPDDSSPKPFTGRGKHQAYFIHEEVLTGEVKPGQLLLARLFPHQGQYVLSGMAAVMNPNAAIDIKTLIRQKKLIPAYILKDLDGVELENLFGRSLMEIERCANPLSIHAKLRRYVDEICPGRMRFAELLGLIKRSADPFQAAATLCDTMSVFCRHEMDLILALTMAAWFHEHQRKSP